MTKNNEFNKEYLLSDMRVMYQALTRLVDSWGNDEQALFEQFIATGGVWNIPSLDEVHAEIGAYIAWLASR